MTVNRPWGADSLPSGPVVKICGLTRLEDVLLACAFGAWALGFVFAPSPRRLTPAEARRLVDSAAVARSPVGSPWRWADAGTRGESRAQREAALRGPGGPAAPLAIGVFGDVTAAEVARVVEHVGLDAVQLHGRTGPAAADVREALAGWVCPLALGAAGAVSRPSSAVRPDRSVGISPAPVPQVRPPLIIQAVPVPPDGVDPGELRHAIAKAAAEADLVLLDTRTAGQFGGTGTTFPWRLALEAVGCAPFLVAGGIDAENVRVALEESGAWGVDVSSGVESSPGNKDARLVGRLLARVEAMRGATSGRTSTDERQEGLRT